MARPKREDEIVHHTLRFSEKLHNMIKISAAREKRSFNAHVVFILEEYLYKHGGLFVDELPFTDLRTKIDIDLERDDE